MEKHLELKERFDQLMKQDMDVSEHEQEWFEFKENWFQPEALGEYVSALSNAAAFHYKKYAYFIWGVNDTTHEIVGTTFNQYCEYNKEPYQNYLARNLSPSINFSFEETEIYGKRVVGLVIPAATEIPTAFKEKRFLRIGSSKCNMKDFNENIHKVEVSYAYGYAFSEDYADCTIKTLFDKADKHMYENKAIEKAKFEAIV